MKEIGYPQDIALETLFNLYVNDKRLVKELDVIREEVKKSIGQSGVLQLILPHPLPLIIKKNLYSRLTTDWEHMWKAYVNVFPDSLKTDIEKISKKWGLNSTWGCGFIIFLCFKRPPSEYSTEISLAAMSPFHQMPIPLESRQKITLEINPYDDNASIQKMISRVRKDAKAEQKNIRRNLEKMDFRGFSRGNKKDIAPQVRWLYWHFTPPYRSAYEISVALHNSGVEVDQFYIQRCYRAIAKMLGIKLTRGYQRGRKRDSDERTELRK